MFDCGFTKENNWFRYRAAAIIVENGCVLLATNDRVDYYYSVGGGVQMGEKAEDAVIREVFEETNVSTRIINGFRKVIIYSPKESVIKDVVFFIGEATSDSLIPQTKEVNETKWVSVEEAMLLIEYTNEKNILKENMGTQFDPVIVEYFIKGVIKNPEFQTCFL